MAGKFYCATSLNNADQAKIVIRRLCDFGHECSYDWTSHGKVSGHQAMLDICLKELEGVLEADVVVVLWPGRRGTHVELGAALATNKPVFFIVPPDFDADVSFYHHTNIITFDNLDKAIEVIHKNLSIYESAFKNNE